MTGVAMPLISDEFKMSPAQHGVVGAATLFGILVGAVGLGSLSTVPVEADVRYRDVHLHDLPVPSCGEPGFCLAGCLPVRYWRCSRLRLPDRALDHFRKLFPAACAVD